MSYGLFTSSPVMDTWFVSRVELLWVNIYVCVCVCTRLCANTFSFLLSRCQGVGLSGSPGEYMSNALKNCQVVVQASLPSPPVMGKSSRYSTPLPTHAVVRCFLLSHSVGPVVFVI